eukprot:1160947-Pelagomonas_calceolata.AAC.8
MNTYGHCHELVGKCRSARGMSHVLVGKERAMGVIGVMERGKGLELVGKSGVIHVSGDPHAHIGCLAPLASYASLPCLNRRAVQPPVGNFAVLGRATPSTQRKNTIQALCVWELTGRQDSRIYNVPISALVCKDHSDHDKDVPKNFMSAYKRLKSRAGIAVKKRADVTAKHRAIQANNSGAVNSLLASRSWLALIGGKGGPMQGCIPAVLESMLKKGSKLGRRPFRHIKEHRAWCLRLCQFVSKKLNCMFKGARQQNVHRQDAQECPVMAEGTRAKYG